MKNNIAVLMLVLLSLQGKAQIGDTTLWSPDGAVQAVYLRDSLLYVGGSFTMVSPVVGHFAVVDSSTAQLLHPFPLIRGTVNCMAKDSIGRIYVGGNFVAVGNVSMMNLFRMDTSGMLDLSFQPDPDGEVSALYVYQNDLYVGGNFTSIAGFNRSYGAKFNVTRSFMLLLNGSESVYPDSTLFYSASFDTLTDFDPQGDGAIYSYDVDPSTGLVFVGGNFHQLGGTMNDYLALLDPTIGTYYPGIGPPWSPTINGPVRSIAVSGSRVYVAGDFTTIAAIQRKGLAALFTSNATTDLSRDASLNGFANDIKIVGGRIYVGGAFTISHGQFRNHIACLTTDLNLLPWAPSVSSDVQCIQPWHNTVCIGGKFTAVGSDLCYHAAMIDTATGLALSWNPMFNGNVRAIMPDATNHLYCGGDFFGANGVLRNNLCAININTKQPNVWAPSMSGAVTTITANTNSLFVAGNFTNVNAINRNRIASFDLATGNLNAFDPGVNGLVRTFAATDSLLFIGGNFSFTGGQFRENIACLEIGTSTASVWDPGCQGTVNKLIIDHSHLYVAGFYSHLGSLAHDNLGRVNLQSGAADANWNCNTNDGIYDIDLYQNKLFLGGWFVNVNGSSRDYFAAIDTIDGNLFADDPGFNDYIRCFARYGSDLFIAGPFNGTASTSNYPALCDLDNSTNTFEAWAPLPSAFPPTIAVDQNWLFLGGSFITAGHNYHPNLAMVNVNYVTALPDLNTTLSDLNVFPNPSHGTFEVNAENVQGGISSYTITDLTGRIILDKTYSGTISTEPIIIDLTGSSNGIYLLKMVDKEGRIYCRKLLLQ